MRELPTLPPEDIKELLGFVREKVATTVPKFKGQETETDRELWKFASDFAAEWDAQNTSDDLPGYVFEQQLSEEAKIMHAMSWQHIEGDSFAWYMLGFFVARLAKQGDKFAEQFLMLLSAPGAYEGMSFPPKWAHYGCQTVEVDEKLAASWCATGLSPQFIDDAALPWPAFLIRVPKFLAGFTVNGEPLLRISVMDDEPYEGFKRIRVTLLTANKYRTFYVSKVAGLAAMKGDEDLVSYDMLNMAAESETPPSDVRLMWATCRIALGVILTVGHDPGVRRFAPTPNIKRSSMGSPRYGTPPTSELWKIGRPVKVDVRTAIVDWIKGDTKRRVQVRTLVAGHWKRQPIGPGRQQRKWIQIEPYFRGPEDGALTVRPHVVR